MDMLRSLNNIGGNTRDDDVISVTQSGSRKRFRKTSWFSATWFYSCTLLALPAPPFSGSQMSDAFERIEPGGGIVGISNGSEPARRRLSKAGGGIRRTERSERGGGSGGLTP
jgi:hypothetical protein